MSGQIVIVGAGGFGREVFGILSAINLVHPGTWDCLGFVDDNPSALAAEAVERLGSRLLGTVSSLDRLARTDVSLVLAVGSPTTRAMLADRMGTNGAFKLPVLVHPDASVGPDSILGPGSVVAAGARLSTNIRAGAHVQVDQNVTVGHDAVLAAYVRLNPQACVSGAVVIGEGGLVGANATILQGLEVGPGAVIGAGAVVVRPVSAGTTVKGVPAR